MAEIPRHITGEQGLMWSEKYRPRTISSMVGNEQSRSDVQKWFSTWKRGTKPLLLTGPPGIGKTTISRILSAQYGYDIVELNASDTRSKSRLAGILDPIIDNQGLADQMMIFLDEVDGIHGRSDYGGGQALLSMLNKVTIPTILAANSESVGKMQGFIKISRHVRFHPIPPRLMRVYLNHVLNKEGVIISPGVLIRIVAESRGDVRSMLNIAQSLMSDFDIQTVESFQESSVEEGIDAFFKAKSVAEAASVLNSMRMDPREKINAFYSSVVTSPLDPKNLSRMLNIISKADMLHGRIMRTQNWRLLRYLNAILLPLYQEDMPVRYAQYNLPFPILNKIRFEGRARRELNQYVGRHLHMSGSAAATITIPYIIQLIRNKKMQAPKKHADIISKVLAK